jgi:hypothetical protein
MRNYCSGSPLHVSVDIESDMSNCCPHNFVDWLAALGPTLATVFAGVATISVYKRGEQLQRQITRPLLVIHHRVAQGAPFWHWIIEVRNEGQGPANIEAFTIVAGEEIVELEPTESPTDYWNRVLTALGVLRVHSVTGNAVLPPLSIGGGAEYLLLDAHIGGEPRAINAVIRRLEIRVRYKSALGDQVTLHHRFDQG